MVSKFVLFINLEFVPIYHVIGKVFISVFILFYSINYFVFTLLFKQSNKCEQLFQDVNRVPLQECLIDIYNLFIRIHQFNIGLIIWDVKWWYRIAYDILKIPNQMKFHIYNPNLTNWLTNPDQDQSSLLSEAQKLNPHVVDSILTKVASSEYLGKYISYKAIFAIIS